jgi:hypothetical protein
MKNLVLALALLGSFSTFASDICLKSVVKKSVKQTVDDKIVAETHSFTGSGINGQTPEGKPNAFKISIVPLSSNSYNLLNEAAMYRENNLCIQGTFSGGERPIFYAL